MLKKKAFVIGLDCLAPKYFLGEYIDNLPNIKKLMKCSVWGEMDSSIPPITVPAWMCMLTGKDPGTLGIYGFRDRTGYSYDALKIVNSGYVKEKTIWDIIAKQEKKSVALAIPPSFPPKKINGAMIGCFLTPDTTLEYTYPKSLKKEIEEEFGSYMIDVDNFRTEDKDRLLKDVYSLSDNRFRLAEYLMQKLDWDFFMFVDIGPDRIHHAFWKYIDKSHKKFVKGNKYEDVLREYYVFLDKKIGDLIAKLDENTTVYIVSDHGAKKIDGGFCINEWLIKKGYLTLKEYPKKPSKLDPSMVDWKKTRVWGEGGYYARIFFNIKGREPEGVIEKNEYSTFKNELIAELKAIKYINSDSDKTIVYEPADIYKTIKGIPPDLFVFFGDLSWRSIGSIGHNNIYVFENDTGPDDANHDYKAVFLMHDKEIEKPGPVKNTSIYDIAPTVLHNMGFDIPEDMSGKVVCDVTKKERLGRNV